MPAEHRQITAADILPLREYTARRKALKAALVEHKRHRRVEVGPVATFYFESYQSMLGQVQEMLYIEKGGEEQLADELAAYNPMIPNGSELTATLMFEIDDELRRHRVLSSLGGVEDRIFLNIGTDKIRAVPEQDLERTNAAGKTSSVHFLHFPLSPAHIAAFKSGDVPITLSIEHENYGHLAMISPTVRMALAEDLI